MVQLSMILTETPDCLHWIDIIDELLMVSLSAWPTQILNTFIACHNIIQRHTTKTLRYFIYRVLTQFHQTNWPEKEHNNQILGFVKRIAFEIKYITWDNAHYWTWTVILVAIEPSHRHAISCMAKILRGFLKGVHYQHKSFKAKNSSQHCDWYSIRRDILYIWKNSTTVSYVLKSRIE